MSITFSCKRLMFYFNLKQNVQAKYHVINLYKRKTLYLWSKWNVNLVLEFRWYINILNVFLPWTKKKKSAKSLCRKIFHSFLLQILIKKSYLCIWMFRHFKCCTTQNTRQILMRHHHIHHFSVTLCDAACMLWYEIYVLSVKTKCNTLQYIFCFFFYQRLTYFHKL